MSGVGVILPFRGLGSSKSRLRAIRPNDWVDDLTSAMLSHVARACRAALPDAPILVMTRCAQGVNLGDIGGVRVVEAALDLNAAIERGREILAAEGLDRVLVIGADLAGVSPEDVCAIADARSAVAIAPDRYGSGANALAFPASEPGFARFEGASAARHATAARARALSVDWIVREGLARDIDTPENYAADAQLVSTLLAKAGDA